MAKRDRTIVSTVKFDLFKTSTKIKRGLWPQEDNGSYQPLLITPPHNWPRPWLQLLWNRRGNSTERIFFDPVTSDTVRGSVNGMRRNSIWPSSPASAAQVLRVTDRFVLLCKRISVCCAPPKMKEDHHHPPNPFAVNNRGPWRLKSENVNNHARTGRSFCHQSLTKPID